MKTEIKDYGKIGHPRLMDLQVYEISKKDLENDNYSNIKLIYEGMSDDMPEDISNLHYYKALLGHPAKYYIVKDNN